MLNNIERKTYAVKRRLIYSKTETLILISDCYNGGFTEGRNIQSESFGVIKHKKI